MSTAIPNNYKEVVYLKGHKGPVNALTFSKDGNFLFSGGDNRVVRVWNCTTTNTEQILKNDQWGSITCLTYLSADTRVQGLVDAISIRSARGIVSTYPREQDRAWFLHKRSFNEQAFAFNNSVDTQCFNQLNRRLFVAGHSGHLKMYTLDDSGRGGQSVLVYGLESGEM
ncbi:hypothetical protein DXG01_012962 [Tephrocybe rancida]|nr:hypothetical protein DXG01_012962 [Tephrocybe rancida]